jgi:chemotaxis protein MotB
VARRKRKHDHENHERWLVSYADFITLLFAFFVVMYAISQTDLKKLRQVAESMKKAFNAPVPPPSSMLELGGSGGGEIVPHEGLPPHAQGGRLMDLPAGKTHTEADPNPEIQGLKERLEENIALSLPVGARERARVVQQAHGLVLKLSVPEFFEPGRAQIASDLLPLFDRVAETLKASKLAIRVEGHADPEEAKLPGVRDLWTLSSERALGVVRDWEKRLGFDPLRLSVAGRGATRPVMDGKSAREQALNRRIEIWILAEEPDLNQKKSNHSK